VYQIVQGETDWTEGMIETLIVRAMALQAQGEVDRALDALERALTLAEPGGYVRIFVEEGPPMAELLSAFSHRRPATAPRQAYVGRLVQSFMSEVSGSGWAAAPVPGLPPKALETETPLVEPLSARELEVLQLLATPLSGPEIARQLVISVTTVRSHTKSIYAKLSVHRRVDAVERAKELGLV
jgi:LuxR family maltose regulon positive regulatory protein